MSFIEMTGATLEKIVADDELHHDDLAGAGVHEQTIVRVNRQGDIEVRRPSGWDVIGGLLGEVEVAEQANERGEHAAGTVAVDGVDLVADLVEGRGRHLSIVGDAD